jgi:ATP-dependent DNA helicase RecG
MPQVSIFISSVQREFAAERRALKEFIEGDALLRRFFSAFIFEDLPARDQRADEAYLDAVERCAVYVGLFGLEYGSEDAQGISPTQREFEHATRLGRPRLVFVKRTEQGTRHVKMEALVRQAEGAGHPPGVRQPSRTDGRTLREPGRTPESHGRAT